MNELARSGTGTYLAEDLLLIISPTSSPPETSVDDHEPFPTELSLGGEEGEEEEAYGCISSNKPKSLPSHSSSTSSKRTRNEDRIALGHLNDNDNDMLYAAVFDGHGGKARCSHFVSQRFHHRLGDRLTTSGEEEDSSSVEQCLVDTFLQLDEEFRQEVDAQQQQQQQQLPKMCCQFFNENPCMCQNPRIPANEGSTGTVVLVTAEYIYCANVGDSDAVCFGSRLEEEEEHDNDNQEESSRKRCRQIVVDDDDTGDTQTIPPSLPPTTTRTTEYLVLTHADTPVVDAANEDYQRIRHVVASRSLSSQRSHSSSSSSRTLPKDGIITNPRGARHGYVAVAGARSLNMVRAFGNLGNKRFSPDTGELVERESAIICRPHVRRIRRTPGMRAIVLGSDGLWDNITPQEIALCEECGWSGSGSRVDAKRVSEHLLDWALRSRRKQDDISVVCIVL